MTDKKGPPDRGGGGRGQTESTPQAYRRRRRKAKPAATLAELLKADRNAGTVYLALRWLAGDARQLNTTRARIAVVCGLYRDTITKAVTALHDCGWIVRRWGFANGRRWYRLNFPLTGLFPMAVKTRSRDRRKHKTPIPAKTGPRGLKRTGKNPLKGTVPYTGKNPPYSLERVGASYGPAPTPTGGAERTPPATRSTTDDPGKQELRPITEWLGLTDNA